MTLEEFVSSLNNEQLWFIYNSDVPFDCALFECVEFAMELRGLL